MDILLVDVYFKTTYVPTDYILLGTSDMADMTLLHQLWQICEYSTIKMFYFKRKWYM